MDVQATFFATLVDEWVRCGIRDAVICPGNRSTLLSATLVADGRVRVHVMVDERSASFFALGLGLATGTPALLWCTSGTATAELSAAVIEADRAQVPLLVCTADRPPELHHAKDWQTVDQSGLYAGWTRWRFEPGVASLDMAPSWRSIAARSVAETRFSPSGPGPVHLNLAIREPWSLEVGELPPGRDGGAAWHVTDPGELHPGRSVIAALTVPEPRPGVIVVGRSDVDPEAVSACARALGWPVIAEARSGCRIPEVTTIAAADDILRNSAFAARHRPEVVLRIGTPVLSKTVATWLAECAAEEWLVHPADAWEGPSPSIGRFVRADPTLLCRAIVECLPRSFDATWLADWHAAERAAQDAIGYALAAHEEVTEPGIARMLTAALPEDANLFAATSMPVRDVEWYSAPRTGLRVLANRGASGMEGIVSTAAGTSLATGRPTALLIGDLSFLYDLNALWNLHGVSGTVRLVIVVVDNAGGGIFSLIPQLSSFPPDTFERVVATPHSVGIPGVVEALGLPVSTITHTVEFVPALEKALETGGISVIYARTDRVANARVHEEIHAAVDDALGS